MTSGGLALAPQVGNPEQKTNPRPERLPALDGLRGIAVLLVLLNHLGVMRWGYLGVDIFFALSGFLITRGLCTEWDATGRVRLRAFYLRRARRLLPALFALLVVYAVVVGSVRYAAVALSFGANWFVAAGLGEFGPLTPTWTLAQEEQFYLLWPLALGLLLRLPAVLRLVLTGAAVWFLVDVLAGNDQMFMANDGYFSPYLRTAELLIGCLAALALRQGWLTRPLGAQGAAWPLVAVAVYVGWAEMPLALRLPSMAALAAVLIAALVLRPRGTLSRILGCRPLRFTGRISYGLYLYQLPILVAVTELLSLSDQPWSCAAVVITLSYAVSALSWYGFESHFLRGARRPSWLGWLPPGRKEGSALPAPRPRTTEAAPAPVLRVEAGELLRPLPAELSAGTLLTRPQCQVLAACLGLPVAALALHVLTGVGPSGLTWVRGVMLALICANLLVVATNTLVVLLGARDRRRQTAPSSTSAREDLPSYTVLVPLYEEAEVLPDLVTHLARLDYPADRLQILLTIEEDDRRTRDVLDSLVVPDHFETCLITPSMPRTKPKACNLALRRATGELCVIYDAEDRPDPGQLKAAVGVFSSAPAEVMCLQAELQYWNPGTNWLTECFAMEYATRYSLILPGLYRLGFPILLGGTSNHFRTAALCELGAWDPHNLTEDADLGIRIARRGWQVRPLASVTEEEANSHLGNWLRQRSRWMKGHIQTWLVHMRRPMRLHRELGTAGFIGLQLTLGLPLLCMLLNPLGWALSVVSLFVPGLGNRLLPADLHGLSLALCVTGVLLALSHQAAGATVRRLVAAVPTLITGPAYWMLLAAAGYRALVQLARPSRRFYWEATRHGLVEAEKETPALTG